MTKVQEPVLSDVFAAKKRIQSLVRRTPLVPSESLSQKLGLPVWLKLECLQVTGTFKARGAANRILTLTPEEKARGIIAHSSGNHGRAVATLGRELGLTTVICLSKRVPQYRVDIIKGLGAEVVREGESFDDVLHVVKRVEAERGLTLVDPFDDPYVIAGQGTIGLEIMEDLPEAAQVLVPLSGGGLFSGIAMAMKSIKPEVKAVGVSMGVAPAMIACVEAGKPIEIPEVDSLADALLGGIGLDNRLTFDMTCRLMGQGVRVTEEEIADGMFEAFDRHHLMVEGSGAVGIGAVLGGHISGPGPVVIVVSGGNVSPELLTGIAAKRYKM
ncbi:threonine/serine dehydratase [Deltaproteobacteria bacterium OttesenSCG-928-M10]|nr:threonine/serine dehydratase [Deltaproteobacteria bacterium OttesenSCG-928-M10]